MSSLCTEAGLGHDCEAYGLFADLIPADVQGEGWRLGTRRAKRGLIPDCRLRLPTPQGTTDVLEELKVISAAGPSHYPRGAAGRGTDRRAATIPAYYKRQLRNLDTEFHGTVDRQVGPLERRLAGFGSIEALVAGPWGEVSKDLASLIHTLAECKRTGRLGRKWHR